MERFITSTGHGEKVITDFIDIDTEQRVCGMRYPLVLVDTFSGWVEVLPTKTKDASSVIKILIERLDSKTWNP